jgi:hypothetical protein
MNICAPIPSAQDESQSAREKGREFLEGFQKLGYNIDRIGQSFIFKLVAQKNEE